MITLKMFVVLLECKLLTLQLPHLNIGAIECASMRKVHETSRMANLMESLIWWPSKTAHQSDSSRLIHQTNFCSVSGWFASKLRMWCTYCEFRQFDCWTAENSAGIEKYLEREYLEGEQFGTVWKHWLWTLAEKRDEEEATIALIDRGMWVIHHSVLTWPILCEEEERQRSAGVRSPNDQSFQQN